MSSSVHDSGVPEEAIASYHIKKLLDCALLLGVSSSWLLAALVAPSVVGMKWIGDQRWGLQVDLNHERRYPSRFAMPPSYAAK